jgi:hypothetical protein
MSRCPTSAIDGSLTHNKATMVEHGDARAARLLVGKGGMLPDEFAQCYGLTDFRMWHLSSARAYYERQGAGTSNFASRNGRCVSLRDS